MKSILVSAIFATYTLAAPVASDVEGSNLDTTVDCRQCTDDGVLDPSRLGWEEYQFDFLSCFKVHGELEEGSTILRSYGLQFSEKSDDLATKCVDVEISVKKDPRGTPVEPIGDSTDLTPEEEAVNEANEDVMADAGLVTGYISGVCSVKGRKMRVESKIEGAIGWSKDVEGGFFCTGKQDE